MILLGFTDIHGYTGKINIPEKIITNTTAIVISGDITHFGYKNETEHVMKSILEYKIPVFAVPGNCDYKEVEEYLSDIDLSVDRKIKNINGYSIVGLGGSLPCPGKTPVEYEEEDFGQAALKLSRELNPETQTILISHQPPLNTLNDVVSPNNHVGSRSIREFIENLQPLICFTGHIHEGVGIDSIGKTKIINPGPLKTGKYSYAQIMDGQVIELEIKKI